MSVRPPASTSGGAGPPPPPPKSPARARSRSGSMSRRRGDGRVITLTMPTPLGALAPATPTTAQNVNGSAAAAHQPPGPAPVPVPRLEPEYHALPLSPLRLQAKTGLKRENSISRIGKRLKSTKSFRKSRAGVASAAPVGGRRQSIASLARRESTKLRSILKSSQPADAKSSVATRVSGATWVPPASLERRQSATRLRSILKPTPDVPLPIIIAPPAPNIKHNPNQPSASLTKPESRPGTQGAGPPQRTGEYSRATLQESENIAAPVPPTKQTPTQTSSKKRNSSDILSQIDLERISGAEVRRRIRQHNWEYFHSRVWDPALQNDFAGAYRLATEHDKPSENPEQQNQRKMQSQAAERDSLQTLVEPTPPPKPAASKRNDWRRYEAIGGDEWGRSVRLAMAKLENQITSEVTRDPVKFMKARRESAQLRAWIASQRRTSDARLSALVIGTTQPGSPFEEAFVAELLRENEVTLKHSSNPLVEAGKLFQDSSNSKRDTLLPHYTPFSQYPLLTPLEEIEAEAKLEQLEAENKPRRRLSVFDEKKAARRSGREYKSLSIDEVDGHHDGARCCGLWQPKPFVNKIT